MGRSFKKFQWSNFSSQLGLLTGVPISFLIVGCTNFGWGFAAGIGLSCMFQALTQYGHIKKGGR